MAKKQDNRDIFEKIMDEENYYPAMGALYGAALGGLAGEVIAKRLGKSKTMKTHATHHGSVIGIPLGAVAGMETGRQAINRKRRVDAMTNGRRK